MNRQSVIVSILADNRAGEGFAREHGLALWIEADGMRLLFDTGQGLAFAANAEKLGIQLSLTDAVILSHGHYDHTGGLEHVLSQSRYPRLFCHPLSLQERYSIHNNTPKDVRMPDSARKAAENLPGGRFCLTTESFRLSETVGISGEIPRETDYENTGGEFYLDREGLRADPIEDDLALWINTPEGLVVCVGCAHAGIINTLHHVMDITGNRKKIRAVIGGMHLTNASDERIERTIAALQTFAPEVMIPCHCTGERAIAALSDAFPAALRTGHAGLKIVLK